MKNLIVLLLIFSLLYTAVSATGAVTGAEKETEITETLPADTDLSDDLTKTFLNINIWLFSGAFVLFILCTVGIVIYRIKKRNAEYSRAPPAREGSSSRFLYSPASRAPPRFVDRGQGGIVRESGGVAPK